MMAKATLRYLAAYESSAVAVTPFPRISRMQDVDLFLGNVHLNSFRPQQPPHAGQRFNCSQGATLGRCKRSVPIVGLGDANAS